MFENYKKSALKIMRVDISFQGREGKITYVSKPVLEAIQEYHRLCRDLQAIRQRLHNGPSYCHPAMTAARLHLHLAVPRTQFSTPQELADELGRLNGILYDLGRILSRMPGTTWPHTQEIRFLARYRQIARKRDLTKGWNRSAVSRRKKKPDVPIPEFDAPPLEPAD